MPHHVTTGDVLRWAMRALAALGSVWFFAPLPPPWPPTDQYPAGPPPLHPERMCPGVPLTDVEARLQRQLSEERG
ncbi:DUF6059 family protein [Kitasatospora sp. NPDC001664]